MKKRYVYYKENTGQITDILDVKKDEDQAYIICDVSEVIDFLSGKKGTNEVIIAYNKSEDKHLIMKKDNVIRLRKQNNTLYKIPYEEDSISDLTIIYYIGNTLEVILDPCRISPLYQTDFRKEVRFEKGTDIRLFLKEKKTGKLLKEYIIDAQELLESGQVLFNLDDNIEADNIEIFSYKLFDSYSWYKSSVRLISPMKDGVKFDIHKADTKVKVKDFFYHLIIEKIESGLKITNNIKSLKQIRFENNIEFFIVDKHDPNILHDKFILTEKQLKQKEIILNLKCDLKRKSILYNNKYISVLVKE